MATLKGNDIVKIIEACGKNDVIQFSLGELCVTFDKPQSAHKELTTFDTEVEDDDHGLDMEVDAPSSQQELFKEEFDEDEERANEELDTLNISNPVLYEKVMIENLNNGE